MSISNGGAWALDSDHVADYAWWSNAIDPTLLETVADFDDQYVVFPSTETANLFYRIGFLVHDLNNKYFRFDINSFAEGIIVRSIDPNSDTLFQVDRLPTQITRKLVVLVQATEDPDTERHFLELRLGEELVTLESGCGSIYVIPSFVPYRFVNSASKKMKFLVAYVFGAPFK